MEAVEPLTSFSLVKVQNTEQSEQRFGEHLFKMHGLVQLATKKWLEMQKELDRWRTPSKPSKDLWGSNLAMSARASRSKTWNLIFSKWRHFNEDQPFVQHLQDIEAARYNLDRFLEEYEGGVPSCRAEEVKDFCQDTPLSSLQTTAAGAKPCMSFEINQLNQETILLNRKGYEVNLAISKPALETHQTSQLTLSTNLILAPVAIAFALFGIQQETLHFNRSPISFILCVILCVFGTIFALQLLRCHRSSIFVAQRNKGPTESRYLMELQE